MVYFGGTPFSRVSFRQLKQVLNTNGLCLNKNYSRRDDVRNLISAKIENNAKCFRFQIHVKTTS